MVNKYSIEIVNKRSLSSTIDPLIIPVDRYNSSLGNPFTLKQESQRYFVVQKYKSWIWRKIKDKDEKVCAELQRLKDFLLENKSIKLQCWCYPELCHADTLKKVLLWMIDSNINF